MRIKNIIFLSAVLFTTTPAMAREMISVTVKTNIANAWAIGFFVDGIQYGNMGKVYTSMAPARETYNFGYREDYIFGNDIPCTPLFLDKDSVVTLISDNNQCISIVENK